MSGKPERKRSLWFTPHILIRYEIIRMLIAAPVLVGPIEFAGVKSSACRVSVTRYRR